MINNRNIFALIIGLAFLISIAISNDFTLSYFIIIGLFLKLSANLYFNKFRVSFILSVALIVTYSYPLGVFCSYLIQDFIPHISPEDRIMGYGAIGDLSFIFLSLVSVWFAYKSLKTKKSGWYFGFIFLTMLCLGGDEGFGSNHLFKIILLALNLVSFNQIKSMVNDA